MEFFARSIRRRKSRCLWSPVQARKGQKKGSRPYIPDTLPWNTLGVMSEFGMQCEARILPPKFLHFVDLVYLAVILHIPDSPSPVPIPSAVHIIPLNLPLRKLPHVASSLYEQWTSSQKMLKDLGTLDKGYMKASSQHSQTNGCCFDPLATSRHISASWSPWNPFRGSIGVLPFGPFMTFKLTLFWRLNL